MSSIPNAKMKHAHVHEDQPAAPKPAKAAKVEKLTERARELAEEAVEVVKDHPKTAAGIGAAIVAGAVALVGAPALARKLKGEAPAPAKKPAAKKPAPKKTAKKAKG